jgi:SAM-dependent methyltransferase
MASVAPFVPDRFKSTVGFYVAHRLRYPGRLIDEVARRVGLGRGDRVLDLGCGPGFLALDFATRTGAACLGLDPDPAMLAAARAQAEAAGVAVRFEEGSSYDLSPSLGLVKLVTMGRSFHWMDRAATLRSLDAIVAPGGAIALFSDSHAKTRENRWREVVKAVQGRFVGDGPSQRLRGSPDWDSHAAVLLDSAFSSVERHGVIERRGLDVEAIVGRALSMSATSPQVLGERRGGFEAALRGGLVALSPSGAFSEIVEFSAIMGRRPGE